MSTFDVGIVGGGVAGCLALLRMAEKHPKIKGIMLEYGRPFSKRRRNNTADALGSLPGGDGKLYVNSLSQLSQITDGRSLNASNKWLMDVFKQVNPMKLIKDSSPSANLQKRIKTANFEINNNDYIQWAPVSIHSLSKLIHEAVDEKKNIQLSFDNEVYKVSKKKNVFVINSSDGDFLCKNVIFCVGRWGWRWATKFYKELGIEIDDNWAKFGVKIETTAGNLKELNKSHCSLIRPDLEIGPFSWNGTVIPEDHSDLVISNFRSNEDRWRTDKVSFDLLGNRHFKDQGTYQTDRLGKLAFLLYNDRVSKERIKMFTRKISQLCILPEYEWLHGAFAELETIFPGILAKGYFHVPTISAMASKIRLSSNFESDVEGLYVAGESAGIKGIYASALSGIMAMDAICK